MTYVKIKRNSVTFIILPVKDAENREIAMILYGLKNCDICRKALKSLLDVTFRDVRSDGVPEGVLKSAYEQFGEALLNTRSTTWRGLDADERSRAPLDLLAAHPALMKRPLIDKDGQLYLGWGKDVQDSLL